ncbi:kinase-like protein [Mycena galopus ATCC 62051]|nr:kinase-like protein [Mycena galopus ATCC 62051]
MPARSTAKAFPRDIMMETAEGGKTMKAGGFKIWELELLDNPEVKRKATVAQLYFLVYYFQTLGYLHSREEWHTAMRDLKPTEHAKEFKLYCGRERVVLHQRRTKLRVDQFHIIAQVFLARKQETGEVCALKKMRKRTLFKMDEIRHVLVERDILTATKTPWLVRFLYAFQDPQFVYLAMEYVSGGDFRMLLNNSGRDVNELHKLGYIHRDLKPENFLVDGTGHVKLTDFGLATGALNPKLIESLKVKVLRGKPYTHSVDYWFLGCILFEFLTGFPPFSGSTPDETWTNLKNWSTVLRRPEYDKPENLVFNLTDVAWDAVTCLIAHATTRYSSIGQVSAHSFFDGVGWDDLRSVNALFVPALDSEIDTGYCDDFTSLEDMAKYAEVKEKQKNVDAVKEKEEPFGRGVWVGFTFGKNGPGRQTGLGGGSGNDDGALATIF